MKRQQVISLLVTSTIIMTVAFAKAAVKANRPKAPVSQGTVSQVVNPKPLETFLTSTNGTTQIRLPQGWVNSLTPADAKKFEIKVKNPARSLHLSVVSQASRQKLAGMSLEQIAEVPMNGLKVGLKNAQVERTDIARVNEQSAVQYRLQGVAHNGADLTMLATTVETPNLYYVILAGGATKTFPQHQAEVQQVIQSFQEVRSPAKAQ